MYLILSDADRERLGAPDRLLVDLDSISNREAIQIRTMGFRTPRLLRRALRATRLDAEGNEIAAGAEAEDFEVDYAAWTVLVWLALKRAGVDTDVRTLEFDVEGMTSAPDEAEVEPELPKDEPPDPEPSAT